MTTALLMKSLAERSRSLLWWTVGIVVMGAFQLSVYPSIQQDQEGFENLADSFPEAMKLFFDIEGYTTPSGYLNIEMFSLVVPFVFLAVGVTAGAAATAGEEERGTLDLLLALPITRIAVVLDKFAALTIVVGLLGLVTFGSLVLGTAVVGLEISLSLLAAGTVASLALGLLYGAVGLLIGAATGKRAAAVGGGVALALAAFLLESLAPAASWLEPWQPLSPWHWLLGNQPVRFGLDYGYVALSLAVTAVLVCAAALVFRRRDIST